MKRRLFALAVVLGALTGCQSAGRPNATASPAAETRQEAQGAAQFDYYLLNLSWSPEYCHSKPTAAECAMHERFVLHGLWPQNSAGGFPSNCSNAPGPADPSKYKDIYPDAGLLKHEWATHGTCSGLGPDEYFSAARKAFESVRIPGQLESLTSQTSMAPSEILGLFTAANPQIPRSAMALSCGNNYLTAVEVCLDKSLQPMACGGIRSCRANTVKITPP